jgi:hypothetical protein
MSTFTEFMRSLMELGAHTRPWGEGKHAKAREGGGSTDLRVAKFLSRPVENPKPYHGPTRNRNSRRKRRDRWYAEHPTEPDRVWEIPF